MSHFFYNEPFLSDMLTLLSLNFQCSRHSSPELAHQLLLSLLAHPSLVTSLDKAGETPLAAAVHNPRCIEKLTSFCKNPTSSRNGEQDFSTSPTKTSKEVEEGVSLVISSVPNNHCAVSTLTTSGAAGFGPSIRVLDPNLGSNNTSQLPTTLFGTNHESGTLIQSDSSTFGSIFDVPTQAGSVPAQPLRVMPYVPPLVDFVDQTSTEHLRATSPLSMLSHDFSATPTNSTSTSHDSVTTVTDSASQEMDCIPSPTVSQSSIPLELLSKTLDEILPKEVSESGVDGESRRFPLPQCFESASEKDAAKALLESAFQNLAHKVHQKVQQKVQEAVSHSIESSSVGREVGGSGSGNGGDGGASFKLSIPLQANEPLGFGKRSSKSPASASSNLICDEQMIGTGSVDESDSPDAVKIIFSDWSSIVTIVLGFDPNCPSSSALRLSSVHLLDNFTTDLILNCSEHMINHFVDTVICKLNSATQKSADLSLLIKEVDYTDPEALSQFLEHGDMGVALLVGRRFLNSVVRILALEHSLIKNRFLEMQQARQEAAAQAGMYVHARLHAVIYV